MTYRRILTPNFRSEQSENHPFLPQTSIQSKLRYIGGYFETVARSFHRKMPRRSRTVDRIGKRLTLPRTFDPDA